MSWGTKVPHTDSDWNPQGQYTGDQVPNAVVQVMKLAEGRYMGVISYSGDRLAKTPVYATLTLARDWALIHAKQLTS